MILHSFFVAHHFSIQFINEIVNGCIQVSMRAFGKHVGALDMDIAFGALPSFLFLLIFNR